MTDPQSSQLVEGFFSGTGGTYDRIVKLCTFGADIWWKKAILACLPPTPAAVLDQASGTGILTFQIARRHPPCRVVGVELRREYLLRAQERQRTLKLMNVEFVQGRAEDVFFRHGFDAITSSYLAKYAEIPRLVANARDMLRPGGQLIVHDFTYPRGRAFASLWETYFRLLQSAGNRAHPEWREAFFGLPPLLRETTWVEDLTSALRRQGFQAVRIRSLTFGAAALVTATRGESPPPPSRTAG
jgi:demethylmenaquinone methyltransferase/2-methoxy-6-polyprenyl-1,4-benzoquinol methylase